MDNTRFILVVTLMFVMLMLWQEWQLDYGPESEVVVAESTTSASVDLDVPQVKTGGGIEPSQPALVLADAPEPEQKGISVETDVFRISINTLGASIDKLELISFPVSVDEPETPFILMDKSTDLVFLTQGGLLSNQVAPNHAELFQANANNYELKAGEETLEVPFVWRSETGITVQKTFRFTRASYLVEVFYDITNGSGEAWNGRSYLQLKRSDPGRASAFMINTYTGGVYSNPDERYEKIDFGDMEDNDLSAESADSWVAMIQHYFVAAIIPTNKDASYRYYTSVLADGGYAIGAMTPGIIVPQGSNDRITEQMYLGPKYQDELAKIAEGLDLTIDYGVLWFLAKPLFIVLAKLFDMTQNWGWAIILVTVLLKLIFYPLSAAGYRSMANMRRVQPRMMALRDRFKDDKAKLNQAMMQIYKEEKVNPFGGCLPILVQIPVFISLYWVLLESVEMRQASFILWYNDLSTSDPYFVLPVLMGISMFIQQKLNPPPMDPIQAKVFAFLPIVFTVFFAFFPSGLVLYWVANNILSIIQQWRITKVIERDGPSKST